MRVLSTWLLLICCMAFGTQVLAQSNPGEIPGLELWVRSDIGVQESGGVVFQWDDQSGNGNHLSQATVNRRPLIQPNAVNGFPAVVFDGVNDYMDFPDLNNIRTVFWLLKEDEDASAGFKCLLGHSATYHFHRGESQALWNATYSSPNILDGVTRLSGEVVDGTTTPPGAGFKLISLVTSGNVEANRFSRDRTFNSTVWDGQLLQLLIFSEALTEEQVSWVEDYLYGIYVEDLSLGEDIILDDTVCETTVTATPGYENYLWSNGATSQEVVFNAPGTYWVDATDVFGRTVRDSILISYPGELLSGSTLICQGESFTWDTGLDPSLFSFEWQDGSSDASFTTDQESELTVTITDNFGCSFTAGPLQIGVDDLSNSVNLGEDMAVCVGQQIGLVGGVSPDLEYLWSDGSTGPFYSYGGEDQIWVDVTNANGCEASDTLYLTSLGIAPEVNFSFSGICEGDITQFTDESTSSNEIQTWNWNFGDGGAGGVQDPGYIYASPGIYTVTLTLTDVNGCFSSASQELQIRELPTAFFTVSQACLDAPTQFLDASQSNDGQISEWGWVMPGIGYDEEDPTHVFVQSGFQEVSLTVMTEFGCIDEYSQMVQVLPSPAVEPSFENACLGTLSTFSAGYESNGAGPAVSYDWTFGDGTVSSQSSPNHFYTSSGSFVVELMVEADNGCTAEADLELVIFDPPLATPYVQDACAGQEFLLEDLSTTFGDPIAEWTWTIQGQGILNGQSPSIVMEEAGMFAVELDVVTEAGCTASASSFFYVFDLPEIEVSYSPELVSPGQPIQFVLEASEDGAMMWNFGDGQTSLNTNPVHIYESYGEYEVNLVFSTALGCEAQWNAVILVADPILDLAILDLSEEDGILTAAIQNQGNYTVHQILLSQQLFAGNPASETWYGELEPGEILLYSFYAMLSPGGITQELLCVEVLALGAVSDESDPDDNQLCYFRGSADFTVLDPYPNPAIGSFQLAFILPDTDEVAIRVLSVDGQLVWSADQLDGREGFNNYRIDVPGMATGTYLIELRYKDKLEVRRLLME